MHKLAASVTVIALSALSLVGCSASDTAGCTPVAQADAATRKLVTVTGEQGAAPDIQVFSPLNVSSAVSWQTLEGDGTPVTSGTQPFGSDITLVNGQSGETVYESPYGDAPSQLFTGMSLDNALPGVGDLLRCARPGSRVVFTLPASDIPDDARSNFGLADGDSLVGVVDVRTVYLAKADGADQFHTGTGLPSVVRAPDGRTGVVVPDLDPPAETVVQVIKKGDGEKVGADDTVFAHYTAVSWNDRSLIESTWDANPKALALSDQTQPFVAELEGQTVGSQVIIVVPSGGGEDGGDPTDADVYVVDILGIAPAAASQ